MVGKFDELHKIFKPYLPIEIVIERSKEQQQKLFETMFFKFTNCQTR